MTSQDGNIGLVIHAKVGYVGQKSIYASGTYKDGEHNREYGYWRGSREKAVKDRFALFAGLEGSGVHGGNVVIPTVLTSGSTNSSPSSDSCSSYQAAQFTWADGYGWTQTNTDECYFHADEGCVDVAPTSTGSDMDVLTGTCEGSAGSSGGTTSFSSVGSAYWAKAGELKGHLGIEAPQQRSLYLGDDGYVNFGSGVYCGRQEFTAYWKGIPSGNPSDVVILSKGKADPAQFVMGIDGLSRYYIRSDKKIANKFVPVYAVSDRKASSYDFPTQVFGTYQGGALRLYVNGKSVSTSERFVRDTKNDLTTDVFLGKSESARDSSSFKGWTDEIGVSCSGFSPESIKDYYDSTFNLGMFVRESAPPTSGAFDAEEFEGLAYEAYDSDYIRFVAKSGEGAYDANSWKQHEHAVSSSMLFTFQDIHPKLFQLVNDIHVEAWVENNTTHASGVNLYASIVNEGNEDDKTSLNWNADSYVYLPSGDKTKVVFSGVLPESAHHLTGGSFLSHVQKNKLKITAHYPEQNDPHNTEFTIYSTKVKYKSFEEFTYSAKGLTVITAGGSPVQSSGTIPLFLDAAVAAQSMPLMINPEPVTSLGDTGTASMGAVASITNVGNMPLYIAGGQISSHLNLFIDVGSFTNASLTMPLVLEGSEFTRPYLQSTIPLFLGGDSGKGDAAGSVFLSMPNVGNASISANKTLFVIGERFSSNIPLITFGPDVSVGTQYLYAKGPDNLSKTETFNLFLKQRKDFVGNSSMSGQGAILTNSGVPLYIDGMTKASGTMPLFMPSSIGRLNNNKNLNIRGYI
tara:strand:- start:3837 stop:6230 length:2394 start_codon:yes stop_codon:yes gene_type:complete